LERYTQLQTQCLAMAAHYASAREALRKRFAAAHLPPAVDSSLFGLYSALPALLDAALRQADDEYRGWAAEPSAAKKRFRTPRAHALLQGTLALATEQAGHKSISLSEEVGDELARLKERVEELGAASSAANAHLADEVDDAI
jgi:gamma-glutamyl:cysteine ligase YbdK (ATP-grasp superfamily)